MTDETNDPNEPNETDANEADADETDANEATASEPAPPVAQTAPAAPAATKPTAKPTAKATAPDGRINRRKIREGLVVSVAMDRTAVIGVVDRVRHPRYAKTVQRTKKLYAEDANNDLRVGDRVRVAETRPLSKLKRWRVVEVLERAK